MDKWEKKEIAPNEDQLDKALNIIHLASCTSKLSIEVTDLNSMPWSDEQRELLKKASAKKFEELNQQ